VPDETTVRILVHRQNIRRYKSLLATPLTDVERSFVKRRVAEEEAEICRLNAQRWDMSAGQPLAWASAEPAPKSQRAAPSY
jgi:hypothetical protein